MRAQLGTIPDGEAATLAGVTVDEVKAYRREHGIAPFRKIPQAAAAPAVEAVVAPRAKGGEADQVVRRRRANAGGAVEEVVLRVVAPEPVAPAPAPAASEPAANPMEAFRDQLGKVADHVIAGLANVDRTQVGAWRRKLGVPAYDGFRQRKAPPGSPSASQAASPSVAAKAPAPARKARAAPAPTDAATRGRPGRRSAIDAHVALLGKLTDAEVAAKANVSPAAVTQYRLRRGIAAAGRSAAPAAVSAAAPKQAAPVASAPPSPAAAPAAVQRRRSKLDAHAHLIGVLGDAEVAMLANVTSEGVRQYRRRHGIPSAAGRTRGEAPALFVAPTAAPAAAPVAAAPVAAP
ncbi:MAG: hypothetical protein Q8P41_29550, partial [Pseudomonadota bacterium]|nr:hypothetical protein [Pseudomonadota bacterium]